VFTPHTAAFPISLRSLAIFQPMAHISLFPPPPLPHCHYNNPNALSCNLSANGNNSGDGCIISAHALAREPPCAANCAAANTNVDRNQRQSLFCSECFSQVYRYMRCITRMCLYLYLYTYIYRNQRESLFCTKYLSQAYIYVCGASPMYVYIYMYIHIYIEIEERACSELSMSARYIDIYAVHHPFVNISICIYTYI